MGMFQYCTARFFCCCCTLQSGVIMSVVVLTTLMITMIFMVVYTVVILHTWGGLLWIPILIAFGHAVFVLIAIYLAFFGAYKENATYMINAACFMFMAFLVYLIASIISYMPNAWTYSCVVHRCPDHIWMENSYWRHKEFGNKSTVTYGDKGLAESGNSREQWRGINLQGQNGSVWMCRWQNKNERMPPIAPQKEDGRGETLSEADLPALGPVPGLPDLAAPSAALNISELPQDGAATAQSPALNLTQGSVDQPIVAVELERADSQPSSYVGQLRPLVPPYYTDALPPQRPMPPPPRHSPALPRRPRASRAPAEVGVTWSADRNEPSDVGWPWWSGGLSHPQHFLLSTDNRTKSLNQSNNLTNHSYKFSEISAIHNDVGALRRKIVLRNIDGSSRKTSKNKSTIVQFEVVKIRETDLDACTEPKLQIRLPTLGMMLSIVFNVVYAAFLMYITFTYIAYSNEIKDAVPLGFSKEDWMALQE